MVTEIKFTEDREWLAELNGEIEKHLNNTQFSVRQLAASQYISERQLRRRLNALVGVSPAEYITRKRLALGHQLLSSYRYKTVAQVAGATGFAHPGAFTRAFKRAYGVLPTEIWACAGAF